LAAEGAEDFSDGGPIRQSYPSSPDSFLHQVVSEMRKVVWQTQDELAHNAVPLLGVLLVVIGSLAVVDIAFASLIRLLTAGG